MSKPQKPPFLMSEAASMLLKLKDRPRVLQRLLAMGALHRGRYVHWDDLKREPPPEGIPSHELVWLGIKMSRLGSLREIPLRDTAQKPFVFATPDPIQEWLHDIDTRAGSAALSDSPLSGKEMHDRYVIRSLIEEAIRSSQLEGAATTRKEAQDMLRSNRRPRNRSERMILNNYRTMERVREIKNQPLTPDLLLDLHRTITAGTLDDPGEEGRLRLTSESVRVEEKHTGDILHVPPPAKELPERIKALCAFANGDDRGTWIHPVIRSMLLHFWLSYDHPFTDGNGRCGRALFYWSMLRHGYWLLEFVSISRWILRAPARYGRAFLLVETDENDLTYFLFYHLELLTKCIRDTLSHLQKKNDELRKLGTTLAGMADLNHRQRELLDHALRHPGFEYTVRSHQRLQAVVHQTARTDLLDLERRGFLTARKVGREWRFRPVADLGHRLEHAESPPTESEKTT